MKTPPPKGPPSCFAPAPVLKSDQIRARLCSVLARLGVRFASSGDMKWEEKKKKERRELIKKNQKTRVLQRQIHGQFLPCSIWKETPSQTQHCLLPLRGTFFLVSKKISRRHKSERKGNRKENHQKSRHHERGGAAEPCIEGCRWKSRIRGKVC